MMNIACFVSHPDDETVFVGGTLALLAERGVETHLLIATRGEGGEAGEPPLCPRGRLGGIREAEARCAADILGFRSVDFLPFRDPDVGPDNALSTYASSVEEVVPLLISWLREQEPDAVISHGTNGEYGHPAHVFSHAVCREAVRRLGWPPMFSFSASSPRHPRPWSTNRDDAAEIEIEISAVFSRKLAAYECHRTQHALFLRRSSREAGRLVELREVVSRMETFRRVSGVDASVIHGEAWAVLMDLASPSGGWIAGGRKQARGITGNERKE